MFIGVLSPIQRKVVETIICNIHKGQPETPEHISIKDRILAIADRVDVPAMSFTEKWNELLQNYKTLTDAALTSIATKLEEAFPKKP